MKTTLMKKAHAHIILIMIIVFSCTLFGQKQTRSERRFEELKEFLSLTENQSVKIKEIWVKYEEKTVKENSRKSINKRTAKRDAKAQLKLMDKEIEILLTPEQLKKYESYKLERKSELKARRNGTKYYRE